MTVEPPLESPRHNHRGRADNCSIDCPAHPEWGRGVGPPSDSPRSGWWIVPGVVIGAAMWVGLGVVVWRLVTR